MNMSNTSNYARTESTQQKFWAHAYFNALCAAFFSFALPCARHQTFWSKNIDITQTEIQPPSHQLFQQVLTFETIPWKAFTIVSGVGTVGTVSYFLPLLLPQNTLPGIFFTHRWTFPMWSSLNSPQYRRLPVAHITLPRLRQSTSTHRLKVLKLNKTCTVKHSFSTLWSMKLRLIPAHLHLKYVCKTL